MRQGVSPLWIVLAVVVVAAGLYFFVFNKGGSGSYAANNDLQELSKTKAPPSPSNLPELEPGGVPKGSNEVRPSTRGGR